MKLVYKPFLIVVATVFAMAALPAAAADLPPVPDEVRERIAAEFDIIEPSDVYPSAIDGWYMVRKGSIIAYVSGDARYLLQGDLIDLDAGVNLTAVARDDSRREMMAALDADQVISFAPEDARHRITVFTDIGCTFCRRMHAQIDDYLARGIEVRYVLYPRNGPASPDWAESERVWCATDRNAALTAAKLDKTFKSSDCDASIIQANYLLGRDVGLTGTPAIVLDDGTLISGYLPADALVETLEKAEPQASRQ